MRILLCVTDIANQMRPMAVGLNNAGVECKFVDGLKHSYLAYGGTGYGSEHELVGPVDLDQFDIVDAFFGSFLPMVKGRLPEGLKIVHHFCGSDVRQQRIAEKLNPFAATKGHQGDHEAEILKLAELSGDCYVKDYELIPHVEPYFKRVWTIPRLIDLGQVPKSLSAGTRPLIVHAPTHREVKGTQYIVDAMTTLSKQFDFEFLLCAGLKHQDAMSLYRQADIIIDQLRIGTYGQLAIEAMAMEKVVVSYIADYVRPNLPEELPIVNANPDTFLSIMDGLLADRRLWQTLGEQGRTYVENYHAMEKVIPQLITMYEAL